MKLSDFSSFFELLAGLNLAYAGFDSFRRRVFETLKTAFVRKDLHDNIEETKSKIRAKLTVSTRDERSESSKRIQELEERVNSLDAEYKILPKTVDDIVYKEFEQESSIKPIYFVTFLFCLSNLIVVCFSSFTDDNFALLPSQFLCFYLLYNLIYFLPFELLKNGMSKPLPIVGFAFLFLILGLLSPNTDYLHFDYSNHYSNLCLALLLILIPLFPFVLDFFRVKRFVANHRQPIYDRKFNEIEIEIKAIGMAMDLALNILPNENVEIIIDTTSNIIEPPRAESEENNAQPE